MTVARSDPLISVIIVARNEASYIANCVESVLDQLRFLSVDEFEIIIVDSMSVDETMLRADDLLRCYPRQVRALKVSNPDVVLAAGWNRGIRAATGTYVVRPDAHSTLGPDYIERGMSILDADRSIGAVGGVLGTQVRGASMFRSSIRFFLTSPVGVGNSQFRIGSRSRDSDTVVYGVYRRSLFDEHGYFDESLHRHEDTEIHGRLRAGGVRLYMDSQMTASYFGRDTVRKLSHQMYQNGYYSWEALGTGSLRMRHHAPGFFYLALVAASILGWALSSRLLLWGTAAVAASYLAVIAAGSLRVRFPAVHRVVPDLCVVVAAHVAYAAGYTLGLLRSGFRVLGNREQE